MKSLYKISYALICFFAFAACNTKKPDTEAIDNIIEKYNNENFDDFKDIFIAERGKDGNDITYILHKFKEDLPVYFVHYNLNSDSIIKIDDKMLKDKGVADYFTKQEVADIIKRFRKYKVYLLGVDDEENVYINPFYSNAPPFLLKLKNTSKDSEVKKGFVYTHYKGNWYLNKTKS